MLLASGILIERSTAIGLDECGSACTGTSDIVAMIIAVPWLVGAMSAFALRNTIPGRATILLIAYLLAPLAFVLVGTNQICPMVCVPTTIPHPSWTWFVLAGGILHPIGAIGSFITSRKK